MSATVTPPTSSEVEGLKDIVLERESFLQTGSSSLKLPTVLVLLLLVQATWSCWSTVTNGPTVDFYTFWSVPQILHQASVANIYSSAGQLELGSRALQQAQSPGASDLQRQANKAVLSLYNGRMDATGSPLLYALVGAVSSGDFPTDQKRFLFLGMLCLVASLFFLKSLLQFTSLEAALLLLFIVWDFEPFLGDMNVGNVNEFELFAVVLFIFFTAKSKPLLAGLVIGAATALKPVTLMILALSVIAGLADGDYEELLYMLLGCVGAFASSVMVGGAYFGKPSMWLEFLHSLPRTLSSYPVEHGNFSLSALLLGSAGAGSAVIAAVLLAAFSWLFFSTRRGEGSPAPLPKEADPRLRLNTAFCVGGCGCAVMLLSSPLVWLHYYVLLLPLLLYLVYPETNDGAPLWRNRKRMLALGLALVPWIVFSLSFAQVVVVNIRLLCALIVSATILTLVLAWRRIREQRCSLQHQNPML